MKSAGPSDQYNVPLAGSTAIAKGCVFGWKTFSGLDPSRSARPIFTAPHRYRIYLDVKDTRGGPKTRKLHEVLANSLYDFNHECIERVQQVRSHESELLQLADLLIGALTYANRELTTSTAKITIVERLRARLGQQALTRTSAFAAVKFNILVWRAQEAGG